MRQTSGRANSTSPDGKAVYTVETNSAIYWSFRKMDATYRHCDFTWRDRARFKEVSEFRLNILKNGKKPGGKPVLEITA